MTNNVNSLPPLPAQRYFTLNEVCELVQISPAQFAEWQNANGTVIGYGGEFYTRRDVVSHYAASIKRVKACWAPFWSNGLDASS